VREEKIVARDGPRLEREHAFAQPCGLQRVEYGIETARRFRVAMARVVFEADGIGNESGFHVAI
jgi:hypothetical protein